MGGLANQQVANQMQGVAGVNQAVQGEQGQLLNALGQQNAQNVAMQSNVNQTNQAMAGVNANNTAKVLGGGLQGAGSAVGSLIGLAHGGDVNPKLAQVPETDRFAAHVAMPPHMQHVASIYHKNSFGHNYPHKGYASGGALMKEGGKVPGEPKHPGRDVKSNDTVPAMLTPKEVVLPLSVTQSADPVKEAGKFMAAVLAKQCKGGDHKKDFKEALNRAIKGRKNK
jgi:hypothetical protein